MYIFKNTHLENSKNAFNGPEIKLQKGKTKTFTKILKASLKALKDYQ